MIEYRKKFLNKINLFFPDFEEFSKDVLIISKKYLNICIINILNQRVIIIIIYNKSIFSTNNSRWKV